MGLFIRRAYIYIYRCVHVHYLHVNGVCACVCQASLNLKKLEIFKDIFRDTQRSRTLGLVLLNKKLNKAVTE